MATIIPLAEVDPAMVEQVLDAAFGPDRHGRTAYAIREGTEWLPALSFAALDEEDLLVGTIQCWPVALTDPDGRRHPMIMVGPVAVLPGLQGEGFGKAMIASSLRAIEDAGRTPLPQVLIGDPEYYDRLFGFTDAATGGWDVPGPVERHRLLCRAPAAAVLPAKGTLGPWRD